MKVKVQTAAEKKLELRYKSKVMGKVNEMLATSGVMSYEDVMKLLKTGEATTIPVHTTSTLSAFPTNVYDGTTFVPIPDRFPNGPSTGTAEAAAYSLRHIIESSPGSYDAKAKTWRIGPPSPKTAYMDEHLLCTHDGVTKPKIDCKQHWEEVCPQPSPPTPAPGATTSTLTTATRARRSRARSTSASAATSRARRKK